MLTRRLQKQTCDSRPANFSSLPGIPHQNERMPVSMGWSLKSRTCNSRAVLLHRRQAGPWLQRQGSRCSGRQVRAPRGKRPEKKTEGGKERALEQRRWLASAAFLPEFLLDPSRGPAMPLLGSHWLLWNLYSLTSTILIMLTGGASLTCCSGCNGRATKNTPGASTWFSRQESTCQCRRRQVGSLIWEDPTFLRATKPECHTAEPTCCSYWSPHIRSLCSATRETAAVRRSRTATKSSPARQD